MAVPAGGRAASRPADRCTTRRRRVAGRPPAARRRRGPRFGHRGDGRARLPGARPRRRGPVIPDAQPPHARRCHHRRSSGSRVRRSAPTGTRLVGAGRTDRRRRCSSPAGHGTSAPPDRWTSDGRWRVRTERRHRDLHHAPGDRPSSGGRRVQRGRGPRLDRHRRQPRSAWSPRPRGATPSWRQWLRLGRGDR